MILFPRLGGREGNKLLGTSWISQPPLANVTFQRESRRHWLVLCVCREGVLSQLFPCHWIWSEGLQSCHFPLAKETDLSSLMGSAFPASLASFKENPQSLNNVELEIFSSYLILHYCDCFLLIDRAAFANTRDPQRIASSRHSPALKHMLTTSPTEHDRAAYSPAPETQFSWRDSGKIRNWFLCQAGKHRAGSSGKA